LAAVESLKKAAVGSLLKRTSYEREREREREGDCVDILPIAK
jgi:hypothetical protein